MTGPDITLLIGTTKGAFLVSGGTDRAGWSVSGPHCEGWPLNHIIGEAETGTIWAGGGSDWEGAGIWKSDDSGQSWEVTRLTSGQKDEWAANDPDFAKMIGWTEDPLPFGDAFSQIWSLGLAHGTLYAGTKPAQMLSSTDGGQSWESLRDGLPQRNCFFTVLRQAMAGDSRDPAGIYFGTNTGSVFASTNEGDNWGDVVRHLPTILSVEVLEC